MRGWSLRRYTLTQTGSGFGNSLILPLLRKTGLPHAIEKRATRAVKRKARQAIQSVVTPKARRIIRDLLE